MKFKALYSFNYAGKILSKDEIFEISQETDKNFIKRLITIGAICEEKEAKQKAKKDDK